MLMGNSTLERQIVFTDKGCCLQWQRRGGRFHYFWLGQIGVAEEVAAFCKERGLVFMNNSRKEVKSK